MMIFIYILVSFLWIVPFEHFQDLKVLWSYLEIQDYYDFALCRDDILKRLNRYQSYPTIDMRMMYPIHIAKENADFIKCVKDVAMTRHSSGIPFRCFYVGFYDYDDLLSELDRRIRFWTLIMKTDPYFSILQRRYNLRRLSFEFPGIYYINSVPIEMFYKD